MYFLLFIKKKKKSLPEGRLGHMVSDVGQEWLKKLPYYADKQVKEPRLCAPWAPAIHHHTPSTAATPFSQGRLSETILSQYKKCEVKALH